MKNILRIFKILIMFGLLLILFIKVDVAETFSFFYSLNALKIAAVFLVSIWLISISVLKWQFFLNSLNMFRSFLSLFQFYLMGYFFSNFLPSNIGGDIVRLSLAADGRQNFTTSFVAVFMERFTGIIATLIMVLVSFPLAVWKFDLHESVSLILLPMMIVLSVLAGLFLIKPEHFDRFKTKSRIVRKFLEKLKEVLSLIRAFRQHKKLLLKAMILSIIFNLAAGINVYVAAFALDIHSSLLHMIILVPSILLLSSIPLSINAIGIAEGAYVLCLSFAGLSPSEALSIALLIRGKTLILSFVGGFLFLFYRKKHDLEIASKANLSVNNKN